MVELSMDSWQHNDFKNPQSLHSYRESASITVGTQHAPQVKNTWTQTCEGPPVAFTMTSTCLTGCQCGNDRPMVWKRARRTCLLVAKSIGCSRSTSRKFICRRGCNVKKRVRYASVGPPFIWLAMLTQETKPCSSMSCSKLLMSIRAEYKCRIIPIYSPSTAGPWGPWHASIQSKRFQF